MVLLILIASSCLDLYTFHDHHLRRNILLHLNIKPLKFVKDHVVYFVLVHRFIILFLILYQRIFQEAKILECL